MGYPSTTRSVVPAPAECLRLVQVTDTHLGLEQGDELLGMDTDYSLEVVLERVRREQSGLDLVLATGDLSDCGAGTAYSRLQAHLAVLEVPSFWLPGNHDDRDQMVANCGEPARLSSEIEAGAWQILMLNSQRPGEVGGEIGAAQLAWLRERLAAAAAGGQFTLVCLHHPPLSIGSAWLDEQQVVDGGQLLALLAGFDGVRGLLWGHIHQEFDQLRGHTRLLASPSTCVQFAPGCANFKVDPLGPGYRWLQLFPDGRLETGVSRVDDVLFDVDLDSGGYL